jgi:hypothetical protein
VTLAEVGPGRVVLEMPRDPRFGQQFGSTHAGAVTTLVDTACGYAALTRMAADREVLTVDFTANLLAPAARRAPPGHRHGAACRTDDRGHARRGARPGRLRHCPAGGRRAATMMAVPEPPATPEDPAA